MGGHYPSNESIRDRERVIEAWMWKTAIGPGIDRYDDLHIDQIDPAWKPRSRWITAGFEAFNIGLRCRMSLNLRFALLLAFSLTDDPGPIGLNFANRREFEANLSLTSPSLYLMRPGQEFWTQTKASDVSDIVVRTFPAALVEEDPQELDVDERLVAIQHK
jgi:hypothetical protein